MENWMASRSIPSFSNPVFSNRRETPIEIVETEVPANREPEEIRKKQLVNQAIENMLAIASDIQGENEKYNTLFEIAGIQAKIDKGQALAIASQIENVPQKVSVLCNIAKVRSSINREEAIQIFQEASIAADTATEAEDRLQGFYHLATIESEVNPVNAILTIAHLPIELQDGHRVKIVKFLAVSNPIKALETAELIRADRMRDKAYLKIVMAQTRANIERALTAATRIQSDDYKVRAFCKIAQLQFLFSPIESKRTLEVAIHSANSLGSMSRDIAFCQITVTVASTDFQEALFFLDQIHDPSQKMLALYEIAQSPRLKRNSEQYREIFQRVIELEGTKDKVLYKIAEGQADHDLELALTAANAIEDTKDKSLAFLNICSTLAESNPELALEIANGIEDKSMIVRAFCAIAEVEERARHLDSYHDILEAALEMAQQIPSLKEKAEGFCQIAQVLVPRYSERAIENFQRAVLVANSISDAKVKTETFCLIASAEAPSFPALANTIFQDCALFTVNKIRDQEIRFQVLKTIVKAIISSV
jgi:hypothetical protein